MYKSAYQAKIDLQKKSFFKFILWCIGQSWRIDAMIFYLDRGMSTFYAKEYAFKLTKKEWKEIKLKKDIEENFNSTM